ncbi:MAG: phosphatase PAP2 family protein [Ferruginibacter sp.]
MKKYKKLLFIIVSTVIGLSSFAQNADINLLKSINKNETTFKNKYLELNASSVTALNIAAPAGMAIAGFILHDKKLKQDALFTGAAFIASSIVTRAAKAIVNRQRPFEKYSFIIKRDDEAGGMSFPSGHTSAAFCTATSLSLRYRKWYVIAPSYIFAASVGWARMYQGVHYPSDVLAGALVGACSAWLGYKAQKWISVKKEQKKKVTL